MTIEERFEFLFASIESHDQQIGEIAALQAKNAREASERLDRLEQTVEKTTLNIDRLALAMAGLVEHAADHARRIENWEASN